LNAYISTFHEEMIMKDLFDKYLNGTKVALVCFNKETKHVLELYNAGVKTGSYEIACLIDFSLPFRPRVFQLAKNLIPENRIITTVTQFASAISTGLFSFAVFFDAGFDHANENNICEYSKNILLIESDVCNAYMLGKQLADKFARGDDATFEFNFRWPTDIIATIVEYTTKNEIVVMQGYTNEQLPSLSSTYDVFKYQINNWDYVNLLAYSSRYNSDVFTDLRNAKLNFILGTDYGAGKASYAIGRFLKSRNTIPILGDYCYLLNFPYYQYPVAATDVVNFKERVMSSIARAYYNDRTEPKREIYYKLEGRLEDMLYGFPVDRKLLWGDLHDFFHSYTFTIVAKPLETREALRSQVDKFRAKFGVSQERIEVYSMTHAGLDTRLL
jgi:hypothetical protein